VKRGVRAPDSRSRSKQKRNFVRRTFIPSTKALWPLPLMAQKVRWKRDHFISAAGTTTAPILIPER
jgi:hypothetical protein